MSTARMPQSNLSPSMQASLDVAKGAVSTTGDRPCSSAARRSSEAMSINPRAPQISAVGSCHRPLQPSSRLRRICKPPRNVDGNTHVGGAGLLAGA